MHSRIQIRTIDRQHSKDINIPNEPFPLCGRLTIRSQAAKRMVVAKKDDSKRV